MKGAVKMRIVSLAIVGGLMFTGGIGSASAEDPLRCPAGMFRSHPNQGVAISGGPNGQLYLCSGTPGAEAGSTKWAAAFLVEHEGPSAVTLGVSGRKTSEGWSHDVPDVIPHHQAGTILFSPSKAVPKGRKVQAVLHVGPNENNRQYGADFGS